MEERFKDLDIDFGSFTLDEINALNYLDFVARTHVEQALAGNEDYTGIEALIEDIIEMKNDIIEHGYEFVKFVKCDMSASHICIRPMIEEQELKEAIEDLTEWVLNNCDACAPPPLIFGRKKHQDMLDKFVKERRQQ